MDNILDARLREIERKLAMLETVNRDQEIQIAQLQNSLLAARSN